MRLVQLEGPSNGAPLHFHPSITVVGGVDEDTRARLLDVFRALPAGTDPGWPGLIEAHGVVLDLDRDSLRLLGLQREVDVVVRAGDLPGEGAETAADDGDGITRPSPAPANQLEGLRLSHDILAHGVAAMKRSRIEFEEARLQAVEAIEEARGDLDPFATTAFEQAAAHLRRSTEASTDEPSAPVITESLEELTAERDRLRAEVERVESVDVGPVTDALHRAEREDDLGDGLDPVAVRALARALRAAEEDVAELGRQRRDKGRDPVELIRRIEGARIQLERLEAASAPPRIDADDVVELEAAHDAVIEADSRVSASRIGGKSARQRLDEVLAAETRILTRMGFPTYSAFALAQSAPGPDPETRVELETTRRELTGLEAAYHEALALEDHDPAWAEAEARREELRRDAGTLVRAEPDLLLVEVERLATELEATDARRGAVRDLRERLVERGVDFGDLDLADDEVIDVARVWVADMDQLTAEREALERELDTVGARLLVVAPLLASGPGGVDPLARAQAEVEAAEARLARHRQASDRVAELCGLLEEIESRLTDLGDNIGAQESLVAAAAAGLATTEDRLAGAVGDDETPPAADLLVELPEGVDGTEWYLLTRLAGLRSLSYAGSVPLVLDGALTDMDRDAAHRVLDKVEQMTDVVQVVYLGDDDAVVEWAALRGADAAVITVGAVAVG